MEKIKSFENRKSIPEIFEDSVPRNADEFVLDDSKDSVAKVDFKKENKSLSNENYIILNYLGYLKILSSRKSEKYIGLSVYDFANEYIYDERIVVDKKITQGIIKNIKNNKNLYQKIYFKTISNNKNKPRSMTYVYNKSLIIAYIGTIDSDEWKDSQDGLFGGIADTADQVSALEHFKLQIGYDDEKREPKFNGDVIVLGHSKGGNKAKYITVKMGRYVNRCYAINSQGFCREFVEKYKKEIKSNADKIINIINEKDYVNIFGCKISDNSDVIIRSKESSIIKSHALAALFRIDEKRKMSVLNEKAERRRSFLSEVGVIFRLLESKLPKEDFYYTGNTLVRLITFNKNGDKIPSSEGYYSRIKIALREIEEEIEVKIFPIVSRILTFLDFMDNVRYRLRKVKRKVLGVVKKMTSTK